MENNRYHVVRDWWRSIYPVTAGPHSRLPLDDSHPLWKRIALMNFWIERTDDAMRIVHPQLLYNDPGQALGRWRTIKLERGLVRHPSAGVRVPACRELLQLSGWGQDDCWEALSETDREHLRDGGHRCCSADDIVAQRRLLRKLGLSQLRAEFCRLYEREYPGDRAIGSINSACFDVRQSLGDPAVHGRSRCEGNFSSLNSRFQEIAYV